jgi:hypothetical protein
MKAETVEIQKQADVCMAEAGCSGDEWQMIAYRTFPAFPLDPGVKHYFIPVSLGVARTF